MKNTVYKGKPDAYFETGMEGVRWAVVTTEKNKDLLHEHVCFIKEGDRAVITSDKGDVLFDDFIVFDKSSCRYSLPSGVGSKQVAGGCYTHWIQHGFSGDQWANLFSKENEIALYRDGSGWQRVNEIKETVQSFRDKQGIGELLFNEARIFVPVEKPPLINSFTEYWNDFNEQGHLCYNEDKFDLATYQALLINVKAVSAAREGLNHILVLSLEPLSSNVISVIEDGHKGLSERFSELECGNNVTPLLASMFYNEEDDDYIKPHLTLIDEVFKQYSEKAKDWKSFKMKNEDKEVYGMILKLN